MIFVNRMKSITLMRNHDHCTSKVLADTNSKLQHALFCFACICSLSEDYSLSKVIVADEKSTSFYQYLRYSHKLGTIAFSTPSAII